VEDTAQGGRSLKARLWKEGTVIQLRHGKTMLVRRVIREGVAKVLLAVSLGSLSEGYTEETMLVNKAKGKVKRLPKPWERKEK
jgi:hypothetical protein